MTATHHIAEKGGWLQGIIHIVCTAPLSPGGEGGGWASNQNFQKGGGLTGSQFLEGDC